MRKAYGSCRVCRVKRPSPLSFCPVLFCPVRLVQIRVWFAADVADDMPWKFTPTQEYVTVHPGESVLAFFTAQNRRWALRTTLLATHSPLTHWGMALQLEGIPWGVHMLYGAVHPGYQHLLLHIPSKLG